MDGLDVEIVDPDQSEMDEIAALVEAVSGRQGHAALSEHKRMELDHRRNPSPATDIRELPQQETAPASVPVGSAPVAMVAARRNGRLVGYGHLSGDTAARQYALEVVVDEGPDRRTVADAVVTVVLDRVDILGGGAVRLWAAEATDADDDLAVAHDFALERELIQMRCPLPLPPAASQGAHPTEAVHTRPFQPGVDEEAWLVTNNRAFASHPEQGHWDLATLLEREREPWFDPAGLLMLEAEGRLAGSCWTKVHADASPPMGEIYVIGVDPDFHGRGWGRALTAAGLDWLTGRGLRVGMLYVDADNSAAVSLYRSMGFEPDHVDRAYIGTVSGASAGDVGE